MRVEPALIIAGFPVEGVYAASNMPGGTSSGSYVAYGSASPFIYGAFGTSTSDRRAKTSEAVALLRGSMFSILRKITLSSSG